MQEKYAIIISALPVVTFFERSILTLMLDHKSEEDYMDISGLNDLEKAILFDFQLLSEDEQKSILEFILSLLGK
mgnify:FL=1|jgi:hypothetical protein